LNWAGTNRSGKIKLFLRRFYVHHSSGIADFDVAGSTALLALQPILGVLPERGIRARGRGGSGSASGRPFINMAVYKHGLRRFWGSPKMVGASFLPPFVVRALPGSKMNHLALSV
jgi:hypothetical protein